MDWEKYYQELKDRNHPYAKGLKELKKRGYAHVSRNTMEQWLYSGRCSQDDYDLYIDVWMASGNKMSVLDSDMRLATERLAAHFKMG